VCVVQRASGDSALPTSSDRAGGTDRALDAARGRQAAMGQPAPHVAPAARRDACQSQAHRATPARGALAGGPAAPPQAGRGDSGADADATHANERWSMDFVRDTLRAGRPFRVWTLVDDATRESPLLVTDHSLPAARVVEALEFLRTTRGLPRAIVCDNGPEFVSQALDEWAASHGVALRFIRPGHPVENCFIESFNGKLRDECLNLHHFATIAEAQERIEAWRVEYNTERPHRGLGQRTPIEYAALLRDHERERRNPFLRRELV